MARCDFAATITLNDRHHAAACLLGRNDAAIAALREAVERMQGAG
jgi:hypothetical protein